KLEASRSWNGSQPGTPTSSGRITSGGPAPALSTSMRCPATSTNCAVHPPMATVMPAPRSRVLDPRVEERVHQVDDEVDEHHGDRHVKDDGLRYQVVAVRERGHEEMSDPRELEDLFDDNLPS